MEAPGRDLSGRVHRGDARRRELIDRIILLDGVPNLQCLGSVRIGETVPEQLELDHQREEDAIDRYRRGVQLTLDEGDPGTRELLEHLVVDKEEHLDWVDTQLSMISDMGLEHYLLSQVGD